MYAQVDYKCLSILATQHNIFLPQTKHLDKCSNKLQIYASQHLPPHTIQFKIKSILISTDPPATRNGSRHSPSPKDRSPCTRRSLSLWTDAAERCCRSRADRCSWRRRCPTADARWSGSAARWCLAMTRMHRGRRGRMSDLWRAAMIARWAATWGNMKVDAKVLQDADKGAQTVCCWAE